MIDEKLLERAALYAAGALHPRERAEFALMAESHPEVRALVAEFEQVSALVTLAAAGTPGRRPSPAVKARLLGAIDDRPQQAPAQPQGFVVTCAGGFVQWVNPAFIEMCGYSLDELRGKKLGPILQGKDTDRAVAERMREAVHAHRPCTETILNYHKDGRPYWVEIEITPITDESGAPCWFVAHERERPDLLAA